MLMFSVDVDFDFDVECWRWRLRWCWCSMLTLMMMLVLTLMMTLILNVEIKCWCWMLMGWTGIVRWMRRLVIAFALSCEDWFRGRKKTSDFMEELFGRKEGQFLERGSPGAGEWWLGQTREERRKERKKEREKERKKERERAKTHENNKTRWLGRLSSEMHNPNV